MPSKTLGFDMNDVKSAVRHTVVPALAGAGVAAIEAVQAGGVSFETVKIAGSMALLSGLLRGLHRWLKDFSDVK